MQKFTKITIKTIALCVAIFFSNSKTEAQLFSNGNNPITGTDNVGIGTNTPSTSLFVKPPTYISTLSKGNISPFQIQFYDNPYVPMGTVSNPIFRTAIFVKWNGLIGLHTDNPLEKIHLNATIRGGEAQGGLKLQTNYGYLRFGAFDNDLMSFYTDRESFYFNTNLGIDGDIVLNGGNLLIKDDSGVNQFKIDKDGFVRARDIRVDVQPIPDYVFEEGYNLMSLNELADYIKTYKHLPNVKSESEFKKVGEISLTEMNLVLLEKVEELTLYLLLLEKRITELEGGN